MGCVRVGRKVRAEGLTSAEYGLIMAPTAPKRQQTLNSSACSEGVR
jgi:hypothetical protein